MGLRILGAAKWVLVWAGAGFSLLHAQLPGSSVVTTFAGSAWRFAGNNTPAVSAPISTVAQLATDPQGNVIFADFGNHVVSRLNADGTLTVLAGNGIDGFSGDNGPARNASLNRPSAAVMDSTGVLYIYDSFNARIRRVSTSGIITTYAGTGFFGASGNGGPAIKANLENSSARLAIDPTGNLYLTNPNANTVRRITPDGIINVYAGTGRGVHSGDNVPATQAGLALGGGQIACDAAGNLYIAEAGNSQIRMVSPAGIITTIAGTGVAGYKDGPALSALFDKPLGIGVDSSGAIYVGDQNSGVVRKISGGMVTTIAGTKGGFGFAGDGGAPLKAVFEFPEGIVVDARGSINIADAGNLRIRAISPTANLIATVAGNGQFRMTPNGAPASQAYFFGPQKISFDASGNLLIADSATFRIRRVNADGTFEIVAGIGASGVGYGTIGGLATKALLGFPRMAIADRQGTIYIADSGTSVVYRIGPAGNLTVFAGQTDVPAGYGGDGGPAAKALLNSPSALALDASGNLFIADNNNNCIRKVTIAAGGNTISTYAGTCGKFGFAGDNGPANQSLMNNPDSIAFDPQGNLIVSDNNNNRLRRISAAGGVITTIAGDGQMLATGNGGPATAASVAAPKALAIDPKGTIYFTEFGARVRQILPNGIMSTFAGSGRLPLAGDGGAATDASMQPVGLAIDAAGNVYISDFFNDRIRVVLATAPTVTPSQTSLSFTATSGGAPTDPQAITLSSTLAGQLLAPASDSPWLKVSTQVASTPQKIQVYVDPAALQPGAYQGNVTLQTPKVNGALVTIPVGVVVTGSTPPSLSVQAPVLSFSFQHGDGPQTQSFAIANSGDGTVTFQAAVSGGAAPGISLSAQSGSAAPNAPATVIVTVDPSQLPDGSNSGQLLITGSTGQSAAVPVTITIVPLQPRMTLPERGFLFTAVQGGGVTPPQTFAVLNSGNAAYSWTTSTTLLSGSGWLSVTPGSGSSSPARPGAVRITVNPAGLNPGVYYGLVRVSSTGTANSPQDVEIVLNLLTPDFDPGAVVSPSGLVFSAVAGAAEDPGSQTFQVTNLSASSVQYALRTVQIGGSWLRARPDSGTLAPGKSQAIVVQAGIDGLAAGVYNGSVALQVGQVPRAVNVLLVVAPGAAPSVSSFRDVSRDAAAACSPTALYPLLTSLVQDFTIPANWPIPVEVNVIDDCGSPMTGGRVVTSFSNGDPPLALTSLNNGRWQGTWFGGNVRGSQIVITANANMDSPQVSGKFAYTGTLQVNAGIPVVNAGGVTAAAVAVSQAPLSPGSVISINGANLAAGTNPAPQFPLATTLSGVQVLLAGQLLPLLYTSGGLINAIVPYTLGVNAQYQLIVSSGGAISGPQTITVAAAQPAIFKIDNSGSPQVAQDVWNRITNGVASDAVYAAPSSAIGAGDNLVIYCTGLGPVNQTVDPTAAAPGSVATANAVSVTVGGQNATPSFAGLVSGFTGLYQVNFVAPSGMAASAGAPVVVSVAGQSSAPINVTVH